MKEDKKGTGINAEQYLDRELSDGYVTYSSDGRSIIVGIEHSEMCNIMEEYAILYHQQKMKEKDVYFQDMVKTH